MNKLLPTLFLSACVRLPEEAKTCGPQIEALEQKCSAFGPQGNLDPELSAVRQCMGNKVTAQCVQHNIAEPRQLEWIITK